MGSMKWAAAGVVGLAAGGLAVFWPRGPGAAGVPEAPRSGAVAASVCEAPQIRDCTFYPSCIEHNVPCGPGGYALGFGEKYCNKFKAAQLSPAGAAWTSSVMLCLEKALVTYAAPAKKSASCEQIAQAAFDSHPACYTQPNASICFLPPPDVVAVFDTIGTDELFTARTRAQIQAVIETCALQVAERGLTSLNEENPPPDAGPSVAEQREFWKGMRDKYKAPR
jgi:hypothetical protein